MSVHERDAVARSAWGKLGGQMGGGITMVQSCRVKGKQASEVNVLFARTWADKLHVQAARRGLRAPLLGAPSTPHPACAARRPGSGSARTAASPAGRSAVGAAPAALQPAVPRGAPQRLGSAPAVQVGAGLLCRGSTARPGQRPRAAGGPPASSAQRRPYR